ncbi:MAG: PEP-CTERM sorting domain-containing protein [Planctomycetaceae bacterium]
MTVRQLTILCYAALASATFGATADGGIIVDIESKTMVAGSSGTLDVFVSKDIGDPDWNVVFAQYSFEITPNPSFLEFSATQSDSEATDPDPIYLFATFAPTGNFSGLANGAYQYDGGDFISTGDPADFAVVGSTPLLLARLDIQSLAGASDGSMFTVSLIDGNTDFLNENFDSISFSSTPGVVTINAATAAVPEPSSFVLFASVAAACCLRRFRQRGKDCTEKCHNALHC